MTGIGFTGSRTPPTNKQSAWIAQFIGTASRLHHGACFGSDAAVHTMAMCWGTPVVVHPPKNTDQMMDIEKWLPEYGHLIEIREPEEYLVRNHHIVDETSRLLALPDSHTERVRGSGTWATVRYAVKVGKPVLICYPDGKVEPR